MTHRKPAPSTLPERVECKPELDPNPIDHPRWPDGSPVLVGQQVKVVADLGDEGIETWKGTYTVTTVAGWDSYRGVEVFLDTQEPGPFGADLRDKVDACLWIERRTA